MTRDLQDYDIQALIHECEEKLEEAEADLVALDGGELQDSQELVNKLFRAFHSVQGGAGYLEHKPLQRLSGLTVNVLADVRQGYLELSEHATLLLVVTDRMSQMLAGGQLHADVEFRSEEEKLTAILTGPKSIAKPPPIPAANQSNEVQAHARAPLKALVVEDDFTSRILLQGLLSQFGDCHIAVNGEEAVAAFQSARKSGSPYDLICMDIQMPGMTGPEAVKKIRSLEFDTRTYLGGVRIFMTTSVSDMKTVFASFKAVCDAYLMKPIDGRQLKENLKSFNLIASA